MRHKRHDVNLLIGIYRDDHPSYRDATRFVRPPRPQLANTMWGRMQDTVNTFVYSYSRDLVGCWLMLVWPPINMGVGQNLLLSILMGWTSIYQLFWCSPGVQGFDPSPYRHQYMDSFEHRVPLNPPVHHHFPILSRQNLAWKNNFWAVPHWQTRIHPLHQWLHHGTQRTSAKNLPFSTVLCFFLCPTDGT